MKNKASKTAIWSVCTGMIVPLAGLILGIIALVNAENEKSKTLSIIGIAESLFSWIFWLVILA